MKWIKVAQDNVVSSVVNALTDVVVCSEAGHFVGS